MRFHRLALVALAAAVACGRGAPPSAETTREPALSRGVRLVRSARPVEGQYLVVLRASEPAREPAGRARALAARHGARVLRVYAHALAGFAVRASPEAALALSEEPEVALVEEDGLVRAAGTQAGAPWNLDRLDAFRADGRYDYAATGAGVRAYVVDGAVRTTHADFGGRAALDLDLVGGSLTEPTCRGHGTHVAGVLGGAAFGVAKGVELRSVRVLDCDMQGTVSNVVAALDWIRANGAAPAVVNLSLYAPPSATLDAAVQALVDAGLPVVAAAGDSVADACAVSPARVPAALTAGAVGASDAVAPGTAQGACLDLFAPGQDVTSAWGTGDYATAAMSGTSVAAPHVAGAVAQLLELDAAATPDAVARSLVANAGRGVAGLALGSPDRLASVAAVGADTSADAEAPTVAIAAPLDGAVLSGTATVSLTAADDVAVTRVELLVDGAYRGAAFAEPFDVSWDTLAEANGAHALVARAYDASGKLTDSIATSVVVSNLGVARFDAPLGAPRCDPVATRCESGALLLGRALLGPEPNASNTLLEGCPTPTDPSATCRCPDGKSGAFHVDESIDAITITSRGGGDLAAGETVRVDVDVWSFAPGADALDLYQATDALAPSWRYLGTLRPAAPGAQRLTGWYTLPEGPLQAVRAAFRYGGAPASCTTGWYDDRDDLVFAVAAGTPDTMPPEVAVTAPAAGDAVKGPVTLAATASDAGVVSHVDFLVDGQLVGTAWSAPFQLSWPSWTVPNGDYVLTAIAWDGAGNPAASAPVSFTVADLAGPQVAFLAPAADAIVSGAVEVVVEAADEGRVTRVEVYDGAALVGTAFDPPYAVWWGTAWLPNGPRTLTARAFDTVGNEGTATLAVTVRDDVAPFVEVTEPLADGVPRQGTLRLEAAASDAGAITTVEFFLRDLAGGELRLGGVGPDPVPLPPYLLDWNSGAVPNGDYTLLARARDAAGNVGESAPVPLTLLDDAAPAVRLAFPPDGGTVAGTVPVRAEASDNGVVARVDFAVDGAVVATDASAPYGFDWTPAENRVHALLATAYDVAGNATGSAAVTVTVLNPGAAFDETLGVPACDTERALCHTGALVDGRGLLGPEPNEPNTLGACADGTNGAYHVDESVDYLSVGSLDGGPLAAGKPARVEVRAWIADVAADRVDVLAAADAAAPAWVHVASFAPAGTGLQTFVAAYTLPAGPLQAVRAVVRYDGPPAACTTGGWDDHDDLAFAVADAAEDETKPVVALVTPADGDAVYGVVPLAATATDDLGVVSVDFLAGGVLVASDAFPPYEAVWDATGLAPGEVPLVAKAYDLAGNVGTSPAVAVTIPDLAPPTVAIAAPQDGAEVSGNVTVVATAGDGVGIARVELYAAGALLAVDTAAPYEAVWSTGALPNGPAIVLARAFDLAGNQASAQVTVTVKDLTPPEVRVSYPAAGAGVSGAVPVGVEASDAGAVARVELYADGALFATDDAAPWAGVWDASGAAPGPHVLHAKAVDAAGNEARSADVTVTVLDTRPPVATLTAPLPLETVSGTVALAADAADDVAVSRVEFLVDGVPVGEDASAPYAFAWSTAGVADGAHEIVAKAWDGQGNAGASAPVTILLANQHRAAYDRQLKAPACGAVGPKCASGALVVGRGDLGPEPNAPNTLARSCADGQNGTFHVDESVDAITVSTLDGTPLAAGKTVRVDVKVWAGQAFAGDRLDLYQAADARSPAWALVATLAPARAGPQVLSTTLVLPAAGVRAVRASLRYGGAGPAPCTTGSFDDRDDLAFAVAP